MFIGIYIDEAYDKAALKQLHVDGKLICWNEVYGIHVGIDVRGEWVGNTFKNILRAVEKLNSYGLRENWKTYNF